MPCRFAFARARFALNPLAACLGTLLASSLAAAPAIAAAPAAHHAVTHDRVPLARVRHLRRPDRAPAVQPSSAPARPAATLAVTSCADDADPGTLRNVIGAAHSGDTIDLSALACSTITLTQGAIETALDDLTLQGPATGVTVDGNAVNSVLVHTGGGTLHIDRLTLRNGYYQGGGGCLFSQANIVLSNSTVRDCRTSIDYGAGAGVLALGNLTLQSSTLSNNSNAIAGGGATVDGTLTMINSTVSGNSAKIWGGGIYVHGTTVLTNSTITDNQAGEAAGFYFYGAPAVTMNATIVAGNHNLNADAMYAADVGGGLGVTIAGSHNLIATANPTLPADTLSGDPLLLPLADNGGPTQTHALGAGSPAIDAGSNTEALEFDQRGSGFARSSGAAPDIGAYEVQSIDLIFADGFEVPPTLQRH